MSEIVPDLPNWQLLEAEQNLGLLKNLQALQDSAHQMKRQMNHWVDHQANHRVDHRVNQQADHQAEHRETLFCYYMINTEQLWP